MKVAEVSYTFDSVRHLWERIFGNEATFALGIYDSVDLMSTEYNERLKIL